MHEANQRTPGRQAGNEALGAIDRVEHPDVFGVWPVFPVFLADYAVGRECLCDQTAHRRLGAAVGLGDRIEYPAARFVFGADRRTKERQNHLA